VEILRKREKASVLASLLRNNNAVTFVRDRTDLADTSLIKEHPRARLASSFSILINCPACDEREEKRLEERLRPICFPQRMLARFSARNCAPLWRTVVKLDLRASVLLSYDSHEVSSKPNGYSLVHLLEVEDA